jgi:hypothetical protein
MLDLFSPVPLPVFAAELDYRFQSFGLMVGFPVLIHCISMHIMKLVIIHPGKEAGYLTYCCTSQILSGFAVLVQFLITAHLIPPVLSC